MEEDSIQKVFDCGCMCALESDDSDPARTCDVWDLQRCATHSISAADAGPIQDYIDSYPKRTPIRKMDPTPIPLPREKKVPARLQKRREYYASHKSDYNKYELARLRRMLSQEKDPAKTALLMKRIEKREQA